ncbi:MAG: nucleotide pyrophosphatase/phosphodiesterase family protein [Candidatus Dormiibacterota bacterium]
MPDPVVPRYGEAALADLVPSLLHGLGVPGMRDVLGIGPLFRAALLVVDGLGWELVRRHRDAAPFLAGQIDLAPPLTTGFPSTTAVSLSSIGTGVPPGRHGVVGYTLVLPGEPRAMNMLGWSLHGTPATDLREQLPPEAFYAGPTAFERATAAGIDVALTGPVALAHTGLTRAVLRGGRYLGATTALELIDACAAHLRGRQKSFIYAYHPNLDGVGHVHGVDSAEWRAELASVDRLAADLATALPSGSLLAITGDHGMVDVSPDRRFDLADHRALAAGVRVLGGEPRARHVYVRAGGQAEVLAAWRDELGSAMWIVPREEAIERGWFGPQVTDAARARIGDVVAAAHQPVGVMQRAVFPAEARLTGHHGSLTAEEALVPQLLLRR